MEDIINCYLRHVTPKIAKTQLVAPKQKKSVVSVTEKEKIKRC